MSDGKSWAADMESLLASLSPGQRVVFNDDGTKGTVLRKDWYYLKVIVQRDSDGIEVCRWPDEVRVGYVPDHSQSESKIQIPSIGQIVHYYSESNNYNSFPLTPSPAIVVFHKQDCVFLHVFLDGATAKGRGQTEYKPYVCYSKTPTIGCWCWPSDSEESKSK